MSLATWSRPKTSISPPSDFSRFMISFMVVVFPAPLGPISPVMYPLGMSQEILSRTNSSYSFLNFRILSMFSISKLLFTVFVMSVFCDFLSMFCHCSFRALSCQKEKREHKHEHNDEQNLKFYESSLLFHLFTPFPRREVKISSAEILYLAAARRIFVNSKRISTNFSSRNLSIFIFATKEPRPERVRM